MMFIYEILLDVKKAACFNTVLNFLCVVTFTKY